MNKSNEHKTQHDAPGPGGDIKSFYDSGWSEKKNWQTNLFGTGYQRSRRYRCILQLLDRAMKNLPPHALALELGCGRGDVTSHIHNRFESLVSMDLSSVGVSTLLGKGYPGLHGAVGSALQLPWRDASFDIIVFSEVIEHIENQEAVIREIARVLKPGGALVLTTPNPAGLYYLSSRLRGRPMAYSKQIVNLMMSPARLSGLLHPYFDIPRLQGFCYYTPRINKITNPAGVKIFKLISELLENSGIAPRKGMYQALLAVRNRADARQDFFREDLSGETDETRKKACAGLDKIVARAAGNAETIVDIEMSFANASIAIKNRGDGKTVFVAAGAALPFPDSSFDAVAIINVLEHIPDFFSLISEVKRILRPDGRCVCATPNGRAITFFEKIDILMLRRFTGEKNAPRETTARFQRFISPLDLKCAFEAAGFSVIRQRNEFFSPGTGYPGILPIIMRALYRVRPLFPVAVGITYLISIPAKKLRFLNTEQFIVAAGRKKPENA